MPQIRHGNRCVSQQQRFERPYIPLSPLFWTMKKKVNFDVREIIGCLSGEKRVIIFEISARTLS